MINSEPTREVHGFRDSQWFTSNFKPAHPTEDDVSMRSDSALVDGSASDEKQSTHSEFKLGVPTLPESESGEPYYNTIEIGYAWLTGFRPYLFWDNTTACFDRLTNFTYLELPALREYLDTDASVYDKTEATLLLMRNLTVHTWYCSDMFQSLSYYWYLRSQEFTSFGHFFLSMLQNFLGQVISLTNLYLSIEENLAQNNTYAVHYDSARVVRVLLIFEPVELINEDLIGPDNT